jgi:uncharacterized protein
MDSTPLALVTGASTGIGRAFAELLAEEGYDQVLAADEPEVHDLAAQLHQRTGRDAVPVEVDLAGREGVARLHAVLRDLGRAPDCAILNAGVGAWGRVDEVPLEQNLRVVDLNVRSTVHLAALVARDMVGAGRGRMLLVSSIAGEAPGPFHATYAASKAFVHSFAEAIRVELEPTGVSVTSLLPGPTDTEFFARNDMEDARVAQGPKDPPEQVARQGYDAMMKGKDKVVGGRLANTAASLIGSVVPDPLAARVASRETDDVGQTP